MRNTAYKYHWHVWGVLAVSGLHWVCPCSQYVYFPGLHCLGFRLLCHGTVWGGPWVACTSQIYFAQVQVLGYSTKAQTQLGLCFVPAFCALPRSSNSGDQVLGEHTLPKCGVSYHLPGPSRSVSWVHSCISGVPCVSFGELISGYDLLMDVNHPGSQEDLVRNWEPARSLVGDAISGAEFAPFLLALAGAFLPPCLQQGIGQSTAG